MSPWRRNGPFFGTPTDADFGENSARRVTSTDETTTEPRGTNRSAARERLHLTGADLLQQVLQRAARVDHSLIVGKPVPSSASLLLPQSKPCGRNSPMTPAPKRRWFQFSLSWLLWLVLCAALACWLLALPPLCVEEILGLSMNAPATSMAPGETLGLSIGTAPEYYPTHWPLEVAMRIGACIVLFMLPYIWIRSRSRPATH